MLKNKYFLIVSGILISIILFPIYFLLLPFGLLAMIIGCDPIGVICGDRYFVEKDREGK